MAVLVDVLGHEVVEELRGDALVPEREGDADAGETAEGVDVSGDPVLVSDADAAHKQETLMGHIGTPRWWTEYPPSVEEYNRAR